MLRLPVPAAVEEVGEASGGLERPPHLPRLLLRLLLPLLSAAHETPPSVACASLVEEGDGRSERPLPLLRLVLRLLLLLLSAAHATPLSVACASLTMLPAPTAIEEVSGG